jgi:hypothetical protein
MTGLPRCMRLVPSGAEIRVAVEPSSSWVKMRAAMRNATCPNEPVKLFQDTSMPFPDILTRFDPYLLVPRSFLLAHGEQSNPRFSTRRRPQTFSRTSSGPMSNLPWHEAQRSGFSITALLLVAAPSIRLLKTRINLTPRTVLRFDL